MTLFQLEIKLRKKAEDQRDELAWLLREALEELRLVRMKDGAVYDPTLLVRIGAVLQKMDTGTEVTSEAEAI